MRTVSNEYFTVEYSDTVMFRWSPNILKITRKGTATTELEIYVSDENSSEQVIFLYKYGTTGNVIYADISRALQTMGENVQVLIADDNSDLRFNIYSINGTRGLYEQFGGRFSLRRWGNLPFTVDFLHYDDAYIELTDKRGVKGEVVVSNGSPSGYQLYRYAVPIGIKKVQVEGVVFSYDWETAYWTFNIKDGCYQSGRGLYLRWVDNQGLCWYWLFDVGEETTTTEEATSYGRLPIEDNGVLNEWESERSRRVKRVVKIAAADVTEDEYKVVKTLHTSAIVDAFDWNVGEWQRVRVVDGSVTTPAGNYKVVEAQIEYPPYNTQLP